MAVSAFFGMFAGIYHWYPKMFGRYLNDRLGFIHFVVTFMGAYLIFWPMHYEGIAGMPRRYYDFSQWKSFSQFQHLNAFISVVTIIVFLSQLLFLLNFFSSIFDGRKVTVLNPWHATTLEWTTPTIVPPHGNWEGSIPKVYRWPYDYREDGKGNDFIPQTEPIEEERREAP
jgi:cytochrome c oxidase subunit 1